MFKIACGIKERGGWELAPSEFWNMSPQEWWAIYDINIGEFIAEKTQVMDRLKRLYFESKEKVDK